MIQTVENGMSSSFSVPKFHPTWDEFENFDLHMGRLDSNPIATSAGAVMVISIAIFSTKYSISENPI